MTMWNAIKYAADPAGLVKGAIFGSAFGIAFFAIGFLLNWLAQ